MTVNVKVYRGAEENGENTQKQGYGGPLSLAASMPWMSGWLSSNRGALTHETHAQYSTSGVMV